jgi:hypothetical protein
MALGKNREGSRRVSEVAEGWLEIRVFRAKRYLSRLCHMSSGCEDTFFLTPGNWSTDRDRNSLETREGPP